MTNWKHEISFTDIWNNDDFGDNAKMKAVVERLKADAWVMATAEDDFELALIIDELADAAEMADVDWFNDTWDSLYDWADNNTVWIATF